MPVVLTGRRLQIWKGEVEFSADKQITYRKRWVRQLAQGQAISQIDAYRYLCEQYGDPPVTLIFSEQESPIPCDENGRPVLPSLVQRAVNFGKAAVKHLADGRKKLPEPDLLARLEICQGCELFLAEKFACADKRCGCNLRLKASWASEQCPQGKWPEALSSDATTSPE